MEKLLRSCRQGRNNIIDDSGCSLENSLKNSRSRGIIGKGEQVLEKRLDQKELT
jgi:hypothetical protein